MVSDTVQVVQPGDSNVGMAARVGGTVLGRLVHNPSLARISLAGEPRAVANAAWETYNLVNSGSATAAGLGHLARRG